MGEEMQGVEGDMGWKKAIPEARDRLQSRVLVGVVGALLVWLCADALRAAARFGVRFPAFVLEVCCIKRGVCFDCAKIASGDSRRSGVRGHDLFTDDFLDGSLDEISCAIRPYAPCAFVFGDVFRDPRRKTAEDNCWPC